MRLFFILWVFLPALIYGSLIPESVCEMTGDCNFISQDSSESRKGKPLDEDETSNSNVDKEKTTDLSDSPKQIEGKEKEIHKDEVLGRKDCDGPVEKTQARCNRKKPKCNRCWCKSKDTGKQISFKC